MGLSFEAFVECIKDTIKAYLPESFADAEVIVERMNTVNKSYLSLRVKNPGQTVVPSISLDAAYRDYCREGSLSQSLTSIAGQVQSSPDIQTDWILDYNQVKEKLFIRVSNTEENREALSSMPFTDVDGIAITYHIVFDRVSDLDGSVPVTNNLLRAYGISKEELHHDAVKSAEKLFPAKVTGLYEMLKDLAPKDAASYRAGIDYPTVLTNTTGTFGAAAMFYPGTLDKIADVLGSDLVILPSSVHEVLLMRDDDAINLDYLQETVESINHTVVAPEERLSDFVYHYDKDRCVVEKAKTFINRKKKTPPKLTVDTAAGEILVYENEDPLTPGVTVMFRPRGCEDEEDLAYIHVDEKSEDVFINTYGDIYSEDATHEGVIRRKDVLGALDIQEE